MTADELTVDELHDERMITRNRHREERERQQDAQGDDLTYDDWLTAEINTAQATKDLLIQARQRVALDPVFFARVTRAKAEVGQMLGRTLYGTERHLAIMAAAFALLGAETDDLT